jgi:photosystem II stability/assembly factor-like uncharacterized protein
MRATARLLSLFLVCGVVSPLYGATRVTTDTIEAAFGRQNTVSRGKILFMSGNDVYLHDGATSNLVQAAGMLGNLADNVFGLGSGDSPGEVIAGWRRGTDFAWVSVDGGTPVEVAYTNPFVSGDPMNPEEVAIADGCLFFGLQYAVLDPDGTAMNAQTVHRVDPTTGVATNLTGDAKVAGRTGRISTSQCKAVWLWSNQQFANQSLEPTQLHYYNGSTLATIDSSTGAPIIANGKIFYAKNDGSGVAQVFLYDTTAPSPTPVQLTSYTEGRVGEIVSDGRFVAWQRSTPSGNARHLVYYPGVRFTTFADRPFEELEMHRGDLFWVSATGAYHANAEAGTVAISTSPATDPRTPKLGDGVIAWTAIADDGGADREIYKYDLGTPADAPPPRVVNATPTLGSAVDLTFAQVVGATHNVYMATTSGVTASNYASLPGGRRFQNVTSPFTTPVLAAGTYYFVVTAVENGVETVESTEVSAAVNAGQWVRGGGTLGLETVDVKADRQNGLTLYAAAGRMGLWRSVDGGSRWTGPLSIDRPGNDIVLDLDIRAVAADGSNVVAVSKDGDIFRSTNGGTTFTRVFDGENIGESYKAVAFDSANPLILYAADTKADGAIGITNYIVKSADGGATWSQLPNSAVGEIRAQALAADPTTANRIVAAGTASPVVISDNAGTTWVEYEPTPALYQAATVAGTTPSSIYVSGTTFSNGDFDGIGVYKSTNAGANWNPVNTGLPVPLPRIYTLFADPAAPTSVHAGTVSGYYRTLDGGGNWAAGSSAGANPSSSLTEIRAFAVTSTRRLVAANWNGVFLSPILPGPAITSLAPTTGGTSGGTAVTISGTGFVPTAGIQVLFGGVAAAINLGSSTATSLSVTTPAHAAGTVDVQVTNPDGQAAVLAASFTFIAPPAAPAGLTATAQTGTSVLVSWSAAATATSYQVYRRAPGGIFQTVGAPTGNLSFTDATASSGTAYLYAVTASNESGSSSMSSADIATTVLFSNEPLTPGVVVQAVHLSQLRTAVDAVRNLAGQGPGSYTDAAAAGVSIKAVHITQIRSALDVALTALGVAAGGYTDGSLAGVVVKAVHQQEIRNRIK